MAALMTKRLAHLPRAVAESQGVEAAANTKLARAGLNHYFCFGGYGSGAVAVGVAGGNYNEAELRRAGADYVLASLRELLPGLAQAAVS